MLLKFCHTLITLRNFFIHFILQKKNALSALRYFCFPNHVKFPTSPKNESQKIKGLCDTRSLKISGSNKIPPVGNWPGKFETQNSNRVFIPRPSPTIPHNYRFELAQFMLLCLAVNYNN